MEPFTKVQEVFREVFQDDRIVLAPDTVPGDLEGWDSVMQVTLVFHLEKAFGVQFRSQDLPALASVAGIMKTLHEILP